MPKFEVNLKNSLNTDTISEDVRAFADTTAPVLQNTGIERDGGVTNIYETVESYGTTGDHFITEDGNILESVVSGDQRLISVDGRQIGITSAYGVQSRQAFQGVDDSCITTTGTVLTAAVKGAGIQVNEYSATGTLLNTRTTTFTNLAAVLQFFTSLSIIRYQGIKFADSLEFALRLGDQVFILKESTPAQVIGNTLKASRVLGTGTANVLIVLGKYLVVAGTSGRVSSFDGSSWRYYDGTGSGLGPYNNGTITNGSDITAVDIFYSTSSNTPYIVFGAYAGQVASWSATGGWNAYNKAGTGLWNNSAVVAGDRISSVRYVIASNGTRYLVVAGSLGKIGSYTEAGGWVLYTAAAGLRDNNTLLGGQAVVSVISIVNASSETCVLVGGNSGRMGCLRLLAGVWTTYIYTTAYNGLYPTDNATIVGADNIISLTVWGTNDVIIASSIGRVGMIKSYVKYLYNGAGGAGVCINNTTACPGIMSAAIYNSLYVVFGAGRYASWDSATGWKNYNGTGPGSSIIYADYSADQSYFGFGTTAALVQYMGYMVVLCLFPYNNFVTDASINTITSENIVARFYIYGTAVSYNFSLIPRGSPIIYLYVYKYENGDYYIGFTGSTKPYYWADTLPQVGIFDPTANRIYGIVGTYAIPQVKNGKTRHIISGTPQYTGTQLQILGLCGYTDFNAFSAIELYPDVPQVLGSILHTVLGFDYADVTFKLAASATNIYNYSSQFSASPTDLCQVLQSQTDTNINAYGKITNGLAVVPSKGIELRVGFINGVMAFYSAAVLDGVGADAMGALVTNVGEIDTTYTPDFQDDRILYRYNGQLFYIVLSKTLTGNVFQKIGEKVYKINSISPLNILSMVDQKLHVGSSDYHGQMIFESTAAPATTATNVASVLAGTITGDPLAENIYSNSIDVGDKLCYITSPTAANISVVGYRIPYGWQSIQEMISTYIADTYAFSTANDGSELVLTDPNNPVYVPDTRLPVAIGLQYFNGTVTNGQQTIFLSPNYDGYELGNEAKGLYVAFQLYGTVYLYDGVTIYQATLTNGIYGGKVEIAPAVGMSFISSTPTQAYFLSSFDNSVYVFNGGRALTKFQRLTQMPAILKGMYSTRDNSLLLETATSFIWVRDDIVTTNLKSAAQTSLVLYDTTQGLRIGNDGSNWRYTYLPYSGASTVVPLVWQSSYFGAENLNKSNVKQIMATIYSPLRETQTIGVEVSGFDERQRYSQKETWPITVADYSTSGYVRVKIAPVTQKTLGQSVTLTIPKKSVISDVMFEYEEDAKATVTDNRTA